VLEHTRKHDLDALAKSRDFIGGLLLQFAQIEPHLNEFFALDAPDIGAAKGLYF
jgi:hypothetical protein